MSTNLGAPPALLKEVIADFIREKESEDPSNPFLKALLQSREETAGHDGHGFQSEIVAANLQRTLQELDSRRREKCGYALSERMSPFISNLTGLLKVCENVLQDAPFGVGIAFTGTRVVLELATKVQDYLDLVLEAINHVGDVLKVYNIFSVIPNSSPEFRATLVSSYKKVIIFLFKISKTLCRNTFGRVLIGNLKKPLDRDAKETQEGLMRDLTIIMGMQQAESMVWEGELRAANEAQRLKGDVQTWIMGTDRIRVADDLEENLRYQQPGTCTWIYDDSRFQCWSKSKSSSTLWYNSPPGTGKSVLASSIIDYLHKENKNVAYFFYSFSKGQRRRSLQGLRSLALQLLGLVPTIPDQVASIYKKEREHTLHMESPYVASDVIHELSNVVRGGEIYIVLDGLDECQDEMEFVQLLRLLILRPKNATVKWFITSRAHAIIREMMEAVKAIKLCPESEVIASDIQKYFDAKTSSDESYVDFDRIIEDTGSNFLYANFVIKALAGYSSPKAKAKMLKAFPKDLSSYYARVLRLDEENGNQPEHQQDTAKRIIHILIGAWQSLTLDQLIDAIAIDRNAKDHDPSGVPEREIVEQLCAPLLIFDKTGRGTEENPVVRLCHKTVEDFFLQSPDGLKIRINPDFYSWFTTARKVSEELGKDCLTYLQYARYGKALDLETLLKKLAGDHAFLPYAATFWFQHLNDAKPTPDLTEEVSKFLKSKAFWNCLQVQSYMAPFLFGWYSSNAKLDFEKATRFKMAIRSRQWRGDGFGIPLPSWLGAGSIAQRLLDHSLCCFTNEWREVLITCPEGTNLCVPLRYAATPSTSCRLLSLEREKQVWIDYLKSISALEVPPDVLYMGLHFIGRKLHADILYRKSDAPEGAVERLQLPLFADKQPGNFKHTLPLSEAQKWVVGVRRKRSGDTTTEAWCVDMRKASLRCTTQDRSFPHKIPKSLQEQTMGKEKGLWNVIPYIGLKQGIQEDTLTIFRLAWLSTDKTTSPTAGATAEEEEEEEYQSSDSDVAELGEEEGEPQWSDDESNSSESADHTDDDEEAENRKTGTDTEPEMEAENDETSAINCLVLVPEIGDLFWTKPWTEAPNGLKKTVPAVHPSLPLVLFTIKSFQLEVVDLNKRTQETRDLQESAGLKKVPAVSIRELRFSPDGQYLHLLSISYEDDEPNTTCRVAMTTYQFHYEDQPSTDEFQPLLTERYTQNCIYTLGDRLYHLFASSSSSSQSSFALSYWCFSSATSSFLLVALPPLTCDAKILKIPLFAAAHSPPASPSQPKDDKFDIDATATSSFAGSENTNTDELAEGRERREDSSAIQTLRRPIYFPGTTPRREAWLLHGAGSGPDEHYIYLGLGPLTPKSATADTGTDAAGCARPGESAEAGDAEWNGGGGGGRESLPVVLRWRVLADGWRAWDDAEDGKSKDLKHGVPAWKILRKILRGSFVDSDKPFSVPIRCSLDWTRKAFLSCG